MKFRAVSGNGYPEECTPPLTEQEAAAMARRNALNAADDAKRKPLGPPNYRRPAAPPENGVSGMTKEEATHWFATGETP